MKKPRLMFKQGRWWIKRPVPAEFGPDEVVRWLKALEWVYRRLPPSTAGRYAWEMFHES